MTDFLKQQPPEQAAIMAWPLVCGKEVAARTQVVAFSEGNLVVEVADAGWRNQLRSFVPRYLSVYADLLGPLVHSVEFKLKPSAFRRQQSAVSHQQAAPKQLVETKNSLKQEEKESFDAEG